MPPTLSFREHALRIVPSGASRTVYYGAPNREYATQSSIRRSTLRTKGIRNFFFCFEAASSDSKSEQDACLTRYTYNTKKDMNVTGLKGEDLCLEYF